MRHNSVRHLLKVKKYKTARSIVAYKDVMDKEPEDKLIAAIYAATISPAKYHELVDLIDDHIFENANLNQMRLPGGQDSGLHSELILHFEQARDIYKRLGRQSETDDSFLNLIETAPSPAVVFDKHERVFAYNDMALKQCTDKCETLADFCTDTNSLETIRTFTARSDDGNLFI